MASRLAEVPEFQLVGSETPPAPPVLDRSVAEQRLTGLLLMSLRALSQRAVVALSALFTLALAGSAFALWWSVLPNPSVLQLAGLGMYAGFVLALEFVRRK